MILKDAFMLTAFLALFNLGSQAQVDLDSINVIKGKIRVIAGKMDTFCDAKISFADSGVLSVLSYRKFVDGYFSYLSYNKSQLPNGNAAALDLTDNSTKLNLNLSKKITSKKYNGPMLITTVGVQAKIENSVSQIFNGNTATNGTTLFANFAFLPAGQKYRHKRFKWVTTKYNPDGSITHTPFDTLNLLRDNYRKLFCIKYGDQFKDKYRALIDCWVAVNTLITTANDCDKVALYKRKEDMEKQLFDAGLLDKPAVKIVKGIAQEYNDGLYTIETKFAPWQFFKMWWINGGITYNRNAYDTYDKGLSTQKRFGSKDFDGVGCNILYNFFKEKKGQHLIVGSRYFNVGYETKKTNSYSVLKSQNIFRDVNSYNNIDTNIFFQFNKSAKDISGKKYAEAWQHNFSSTYTVMFGSNANFGLNLKGQLQLSSISEPIFNTHAGLMIRMANANYDAEDKKSQTKVNFEIFFEFSDMSDVSKTGKTTWQNRTIGITTSVPFNKIFFK